MRNATIYFSVLIFIASLTSSSFADGSFTIQLGEALEAAETGRFEMDPLFLGLDNINEQLNIGTIVGSSNATIVPEVKVLNQVIIPKVTGDTRTGARVTGLVQGRAGLELNAHFDVGGIGPTASFQYTPTLNPPENFFAGELLTLNGQNGLDTNRNFGDADIQLPSAGVNLDVIFDIHAAGKVDYGVAGVVPYNTEPFNFSIKQPKNDDGTNFTLIGASVDLNNHDTFGELTVTGDRIPIDAGANGTLYKYQIKMDPTPPPVNGEDPLFHRDIGEVAFVKPELGNTLLVDTTLADERISYAVDSKILRLGVDIDGIASALAAGNSYTRFSKTLGDPDSDFNATLAGELVDLKYGPELGYRYQSSVDTKFDVDIKFSSPVAIVDENGTRVTDQLSGKWDALPDIAVLGEEAVDVEVTFTSANFLLNEQGAITISDYLEFNALSLDASINVGPLPIPVLSLGPVLHARTSVLEHIDFPEIPEVPQIGPVPPPDPFAAIRASKNVLDAIGEIPIFENIEKELISIPWDEGTEPVSRFVLQPKPSEVVFWRERRGWEQLSNGRAVTPSSQHKLIFGTAPRGAEIESEVELGPWEPSIFAELGVDDEMDLAAQSIKILDGSVVHLPERNRWTVSRIENHGEVIGQQTSQISRLHAPANGILTIGGTGEINFERQPTEIDANIFIHESGHTMKFGDPGARNGHNFQVGQFINRGTIEMDQHQQRGLLNLADGLINSGIFQVSNFDFYVNTSEVVNDGVIRKLRFSRDGGLRFGPGVNLAGSGEWVVQEQGRIRFDRETSISEGASPSFKVLDGEIEFQSKLNVFGDADFLVGDRGTLTLNGLATRQGSDSTVSVVNRGTINVRGNVRFGDANEPDPIAPSLVPINLDNTDGTIRIFEGGSLTFDARIANYAEGGATFDVGTWELFGEQVRWDNTDISSIPVGTKAATLSINVVGVGDDGTLGDVNFEGDPDYSVDDFNTAMKINASKVTLRGAASFPYFNTVEQNSGTIRLIDGIQFTTASTLSNTGEIEVRNDASLIVSGDLLLRGGQLNVVAGGLNFLDPQSTVEVTGSHLSFSGNYDFSLEESGVLQGNWVVQESSNTVLDGTVSVVPASVTGIGGRTGFSHLAGRVMLDGASVDFGSLNRLQLIRGSNSSAELTISGGHEYRNVNENGLEVGPSSMLAIEHGGAMYVNELQLAGELNIGPNGSLSIDRVLTTDATDESRILVDGVLHADRVIVGATTVPGLDPRSPRPKLEGNGRIASDVDIQRGHLQPGDDEGLQIFGDLQLSANTITQFLLDHGNAQSRLSVDSASLAGSLEVLTAPGFDPGLDELIELITLNEGSTDLIAGQFDTVSLPTTHSGKTFELSVTEQGVFLDPYLLGDFNGDDLRNAFDIDLLSTVGVTQGDVRFDLNNDNKVDESDRVVWVEDLQRTFFGDANLDGEFNSSDFVQVFQRGKYENDELGIVGWADGDWNGDSVFDSSDFVVAFQSGGYEKGPRLQKQHLATVPEPTHQFQLLAVIFAGLFVRSNHRFPTSAATRMTK